MYATRNAYCTVLGKRLEPGLIVVLEERASHELAVLVRTLGLLHSGCQRREVAVRGLESGNKRKPGRVVKNSVDDL